MQNGLIQTDFAGARQRMIQKGGESNAKHAFKNCDLRSDIYTVARRFRDGNGTTVGAELSRKYKGTRPKLEGPTYYAGNCVDNRTAERLRELSANAPDFKMPPTPWTAIG